jgi:cofilin
MLAAGAQDCAMTDITVDESCVSAFGTLTGKRVINTVVCRLSDGLDTVLCDFEGNLTHSELLAALPPEEPRTVLHDLHFAGDAGSRANSIVLISWCPAQTSPEQAMAHRAGTSALLSELRGLRLCVQAEALADVTYGELVARARG